MQFVTLTLFIHYFGLIFSSSYIDIITSDKWRLKDEKSKLKMLNKEWTKNIRKIKKILHKFYQELNKNQETRLINMSKIYLNQFYDNISCCYVLSVEELRILFGCIIRPYDLRMQYIKKQKLFPVSNLVVKLFNYLFENNCIYYEYNIIAENIKLPNFLYFIIGKKSKLHSFFLKPIEMCIGGKSKHLFYGDIEFSKLHNISYLGEFIKYEKKLNELLRLIIRFLKATNIILLEEWKEKTIEWLPSQDEESVRIELFYSLREKILKYFDDILHRCTSNKMIHDQIYIWMRITWKYVNLQEYIIEYAFLNAETDYLKKICKKLQPCLTELLKTIENPTTHYVFLKDKIKL